MQSCHWLPNAPMEKASVFIQIRLCYFRIQHLSGYLRAAWQCVGILNSIVGILIYRHTKVKFVPQIFITSTVSKKHINITRCAANV